MAYVEKPKRPDTDEAYQKLLLEQRAQDQHDMRACPFCDLSQPSRAAHLATHSELLKAEKVNQLTRTQLPSTI